MFVRRKDGEAGEGEEVMKVGVWFDEDYSVSRREDVG